MKVRGGCTGQLAEHDRRSREIIFVEEVHNSPHQRIVKRRLAFSFCNQKLPAQRDVWMRENEEV